MKRYHSKRINVEWAKEQERRQHNPIAANMPQHQRLIIRLALAEWERLQRESAQACRLSPYKQDNANAAACEHNADEAKAITIALLGPVKNRRKS